MRWRVGGGERWYGVAALPGCRVAGVYNRTICRSLSRTREVRRSANQIGIPPLVHCHKMAALNQLDSAYCAPPPGAPLAARREKLRLSIHFYSSCFSLSLSSGIPFSTSCRVGLQPLAFSLAYFLLASSLLTTGLSVPSPAIRLATVSIRCLTFSLSFPFFSFPISLRLYVPSATMFQRNGINLMIVKRQGDRDRERERGRILMTVLSKYLYVYYTCCGKLGKIQRG